MLPQMLTKGNSSKRKQDEQHSGNMEGITQILEQSMGHLSTNFDPEKIRKSYTTLTNSFGEIEFTGLNHNAKFVRLLNTTNDSYIQDILQTKWELTPPTLVISIFGRDFDKKRKLKMIIKKGLWKAAESAGCWIITEGFNLGIMKLAGDAVRDYTDAYGGNRMMALGVAPWALVAKNDILESAINQGTNPAIYQSEEEAAGSDDESDKVISHEKSLDTNHSHFLLTDCPANEKIDTQDLQFRTRFEHAISSWKSVASQDVVQSEIKIPICGLVVGGDIYTLRQVCNSIVVNKCPIVACQGTSGSADVFSIGLLTSQKFAIEESPDDPEVVPLEARLELILRECLHKMNPEIKNFSEDAKILKGIFTDLAFLISVFDMDEDWDLDGYIISSLLSSAGSDVAANQLNLEQLEITLTLNRADIAKEKIFLENKKWKKGDLNDYMFNALMCDRHDFVKLFLEQGFSLEDFLTIHTLERLYTEQLKQTNSRVSIFKQLWNNHKTHKKSLRTDKTKPLNSKFITDVKLKEVGKVIKVLVGDFYHPLYLSKEFQAICLKSLTTNATAKSSIPRNQEVDLLQHTPHSYENKALDDDFNDRKNPPNTNIGSHSTNKSSSIMKEFKFKDTHKGMDKNHVIRRASSLDMIDILLHSKGTNSSTIESNRMDFNSDSDTNILSKRSNEKQNKKKLLRRTSSLDFIKTDYIMLPVPKTKPSSSKTKTKFFRKRDERQGNQLNIDELDDNTLKEITLERPARELMIWSLLMGKLQMTELFWTIEKEPIAGALLSSILLSSLASKTDDFTDKEDYETCAKHFEDQAEGVLNQCYMEDEARAQMLINKELKYYGNSSVILLAAEGESIKFMAHPCCQDFLTSTWYGELSSKNSVLKLLVGVFVGLTIPFLLPKIITYKDNELKGQHHPATAATNNSGDKNPGNLDIEVGKKTVTVTDGAKFQTFPTKKRSTIVIPSIIRYLRKIKGFYFAPITRFIYSSLSYATFLVLFSVFLTYRFTVSFTNEEIIIVFWVGTLLLEEIKQIFSKSLSGISFSTYFSDGWNKLDSTAIGLFVIGFILRLITYITRYGDLTNINVEYLIILTDPRFIAAQVLISFSLFFFYIRLIYFFSIHIALGPKLIMIRKMISNDLIPFMIILMVFTVGYGVTSISIGYPMALLFSDGSLSNSSSILNQNDVGTTILNLMINSYFAMFGEFGLDNLRAKNVQPTDFVPTPIGRTIVPIFLGFYVLLTNVLLFNLLIAMFTKTYEEIEGSSVYYWNFQRYQMLSEFNYRSPIVAPFIIFWQLYELYFFLKGLLTRSGSEQSVIHYNPFRINLSDDSKKKRELIKWEHMKAMDFLRNPNEQTNSSKNRGTDGRSMVFRGFGSNAAVPSPLAVQAADNKVDLSGIMEEMNHQFDKRFKDVDTKLSKFADIETQITDVFDVVKTLEQHIGLVRSTQDELLMKMQTFPRCQCADIIKVKKSEEDSLEEVTKLEMAVRSAIMALKAEFQPMIADLINASSKDTGKKSTEETEQEFVFTVTDDIGDVDKDPFYVPDVEDPSTGRIVERIVNNHRIWRYIPFNFEKYPGMRMKVPNNIVSWQIPYSDYNAYDASEEELYYPNDHCHDGDDPIKYKDSFNNYDQVNKVKRQSMLGQYALGAENNSPLNPTGRTGLKGRGLLPHWGPNHSITILFTRWSRNIQGSPMKKNNKPLLQYIALERMKRFGIPWFLVDHMSACDLNECSIKSTLCYLEQRLKALFSVRKSEFVQKKILAANCSQTFKGFLDDHLNADNAWVETVVINFHESDNYRFTDDLLKIFSEKNSTETVKWLDLSHSVNLRASHDIILKTVAQKANSFF